MNWRIENIATMAISAATIVGLYYFGAGYFSALGLVFMLNMNFAK